MIKAYYNEIDRNAAAWLRQLIKDGLVTDGEVDERSIIDVEAGDLVGFDRVHFFAGIGTWDYCLNHVGWGDKQIWTASLPCQPFSVAGKQLGKSDERHLLPHFIDLVNECKPDTIVGEQVNDAIRHGWLDDLCAEMESENYAVGHIVYGAHSIGAAHIRNRLYWVAHAIGTRLQGHWESGEKPISERRKGATGHRAESRMSCRMGEPDSNGCDQGRKTAKKIRYRNTVDATGRFDWLRCEHDRYRPIQSGIKPVVDGSSQGVVCSGDPRQEINADYSTEAHAMRLKGYGNAIVAGCAIEFISAFMDEIA